jgi:aminomethyltransferase
MKDRAIARHGYPVVIGGAVAGRVTSGTQTPFLKKAIGMAYLPVAHAAPGTEFDVDVGPASRDGGSSAVLQTTRG